MTESLYDVLIIGSGPAGLTAAIYTTRANFKTLVIAGSRWGGQLMLTTLVENFPGFPEGIQGPELMMNMRKQACRHGAEIIDVDFLEGDFGKTPFTIKAGDKTYQGKAVIIATGADTKWLGVPGEKEKIGRGVSTCAPCDAPFFRGKNVIVVGGGDSAMEEAIVLTNFAKSVIVVHRRGELRASQIMQEKAKKIPNLHFLLNAEVVEIIGDQKVEKVKLRSPLSVIPNSFRDLSENKEMLKQARPEDLPAGKAGILNQVQGDTFRVQHDSEQVIWEMPIDGVFVAIGHMPNSKVFRGIDLEEQGFIKVYDHFKTNIEGVFVAGDVHDTNYKQAITAAGFGCAAALEVERWLRDRVS